VANFRGFRDPVLFNDRSYSYNFAPYNYLQLPLERVSAYGGARFELDGGHEIYGQALYADYSADQALAPTPAMILMPATNPYVPPDLALLLASRTTGDPAADFRMGKRLSEIGPRVASNQYDVYQLTAGLRGPFLEGWDYDFYVQFGENDQEQRQDGNILRSRINTLTYAPDGGRSLCGEFNLFYVGGLSPDCIDYITVSGTNLAGYEQNIVELSASGPLGHLPAGAVQLAVGVMHKRDDYFYRADPIASVILPDGGPDIGGFNASDDIDGSDHNTDVYAEALLPLLAGLKAVERLDLVLGYRRSEYESAGGVDAWKAELLYQPVASLRLRGSLQRAVRAPSVFELYQPLLPMGYDSGSPFGVLDPCTAGSPERTGPDAAQVEALCLAQGLPVALLPQFEDLDFEHPGLAGGNPELEPETGETVTVGLVWTSNLAHRLLSGLQVSLDWYRIEMEDSIEGVIAPDYIPRCFDPRTNPTFDPDNRWCAFFSRDATTGEIADIRDILVNLEGFEVSGVDFQADWSVEAGPGTLGLNVLGSWLDTFVTVPPPGLPEVDEVGLVGGFIGAAYPEWKWNVNVRYEWQALTLGAAWRYVDAMLDRDVGDFDWNYRIPSQDYLDLFAAYAFDAGALEGLTLRGGVENVSNDDPPLLPTPVQANTDASQYDVLGRRFFLNLTYRF
jgi:outer membrane receptor protein involved in Fe transport